MLDGLKVLGMLLLFIVTVVGLIVSLVVANEQWNCRNYAEVANTKMMAGTCYVQAGNGKWVTHQRYVQTTFLDVEVKSK